MCVQAGDARAPAGRGADAVATLRVRDIRLLAHALRYTPTLHHARSRSVSHSVTRSVSQRRSLLSYTYRYVVLSLEAHLASNLSETVM